MAKSYTSTLQVKCWKQHTCQGCGANYSYLLQRKAAGTGGTAEKARQNMQKKIVYITQSDTDMQPCPGCGLYQYDMIGQRRAKSRIQFFWIGLIAIATVLILRGCDAMQTNTLTMIAAAIAGFIVLAHLLLEISNPNRDLAANLALAQQRVAAGILRFTPSTAATASTSNLLAQPNRPVGHLLALLLLLVSLVMVISAEGTRTVRRWPLNAECYPPVVGATDTTRVYMPDAITSIKSFWRGDPKVLLHFPGAPDEGLDAPATTNQKNWGSTIEDVKSEDEKNTSHPWVVFTLPDSADVAGKTVQCDIDLSLEYPQIADGSNFQTVHDEMQHRVNLAVAPRGAGAIYDELWWGGTAGGGVLLLLASLMLYRQAHSFRKLANPTQVFTAE